MNRKHCDICGCLDATGPLRRNPLGRISENTEGGVNALPTTPPPPPPKGQGRTPDHPMPKEEDGPPGGTQDADGRWWGIHRGQRFEIRKD